MDALGRVGVDLDELTRRVDAGELLKGEQMKIVADALAAKKG
jgi:hypothetical protein